MNRTLLSTSVILATSLFPGLFSGIAEAASREACIVLQTSGKKVSSVSYDLPDDLSKSVEVKTDLIPGLQLLLSAGPGSFRSTDRSFYSVTAQVSDLQKGSVIESTIRLVNSGQQNQTAKNLSALRYQRDDSTAVQITCARFER